MSHTEWCADIGVWRVMHDRTLVFWRSLLPIRVTDPARLIDLQTKWSLLGKCMTDVADKRHHFRLVIADKSDRSGTPD